MRPELSEVFGELPGVGLDAAEAGREALAGLSLAAQRLPQRSDFALEPPGGFGLEVNDLTGAGPERRGCVGEGPGR